MEGITHATLAEYASAHPEVSIGQAASHYYAWKPDPGDDDLSGELTHGDTAGELLAKLGG
jgi:hypothetical protein